MSRDAPRYRRNDDRRRRLSSRVPSSLRAIALRLRLISTRASESLQHLARPTSWIECREIIFSYHFVTISMPWRRRSSVREHTFTTFAARRSLSPSAPSSSSAHGRTTGSSPDFQGRSIGDLALPRPSRPPPSQRAAVATCLNAHVGDSDVASDRVGAHAEGGRSSRPPVDGSSRSAIHEAARRRRPRERAELAAPRIQTPSFADGERSRSLAAASTSVPLAGTTRCSVMILCENVTKAELPSHAPSLSLALGR